MEELYIKNNNIDSRCYNFENSTAEKGKAAQSNNCAKGHPSEPLKAGEKKVIFDVNGCGVINHFWMTYTSKNGILDAPSRRGVKIECFWDGAETPAISMPLGEFFGMGVCYNEHFENELFGCMGGKALNSYLKMPFLSSARIEITNECEYDIVSMFYSIDYAFDGSLKEKNPLYLHGYWNRENPTKFKSDFEILPYVEGCGKFVGCLITVVPNPDLKGTWWGEGEVKMYLDGDDEFPTICSTGAEDYPGTGWGMGRYIGRYQGCLQGDENNEYLFYRYHIPDPVEFKTDCRVTIQQIGGAEKCVLVKCLPSGANVEVVTAINDSIYKFDRVYDIEQETGKRLKVTDPEIDEHDWCNFYRQDDVSAAAFFYLDKKESTFPPMPDAKLRMNGVKLRCFGKRDDM